MENRNKIGFAMLVALAITTSSTLRAQVDTVKTVYDTVKVREIETEKVVHDTVRVPKHDTVQIVRNKQEIPLRRGEFGLRFMPTFTSLALNTYNGETVQGDATVSYGYGVMLGFNLSRNIGIQVEASYSDISQSYKDQNLERQIHVNYINIPVMLSLNTDKTKPVNLNFVVGPQFGINVGSSMSTNSNSSTDTLHAVLAVKQSDIGLAYGAGLEFALNRMHTIRFDIGFRGVYGLVNMDGATGSNDTYSVLIHATRKSYGGYAGLTFLF